MNKKLFLSLVIVFMIASSVFILLNSEDSDSSSSTIILDPEQYRLPNDMGYIPELHDEMNFISPLSSVSISSNGEKVELSDDRYPVITSDGTVNLIVSYNHPIYDGSKINNNWYISNDTAYTIDGVYTGTIGVGGLLIQKSPYGFDWYSSDVIIKNTNCNSSQPLTLTTGDIGDGCYIRILAVYELYEKYGFINVNHINVIEEYIFYLNICNPDAIVIKNLSETNNGDSEFSTMKDGKLTTTGFSIKGVDYSGGKCEVLHDGGTIDTVTDRDYTDFGRYEIRLYSPSNDNFDYRWVIFVANEDQILKELFGDGLLPETYRISNLDINVPSYSFGVYSYFKQSNNLPVFKLIVNNLSTGVESTFSNEVSSPIYYKSGYNEVILTNGSDGGNGGDYFAVEFNFNVAREDQIINPEDPEKFTIFFDLNGGSTTINPIIVTENSEFELPEYNGTRDGYYFKGWFVGENILQPGITITIASDTVIEVVWERVTDPNPNNPGGPDSPNDPNQGDGSGYEGNDSDKKDDDGKGIDTLHLILLSVCVICIAVLVIGIKRT